MGRRRGGASGLGAAYARGLFCEGGALNPERDESIERRRTRLSPEGRELLEELERASEASEEARARIEALPPSERKEIVAIFGAMALDVAERQRENILNVHLATSSAQIIREAQGRERAAGRPVDPDMTLGDALEILGR